jgi:hypothetical protein
MTIDEALNVLKQYIDYNNPDVPDFYTMEEACEVVIEALEQEPCADAISRQAVTEVLLKYAHSEVGKAFAEFLVSQINDLPPVTPQYTEAEIQKMQDLEFAEIQKAYEIGKAENPNKWIPVSERLPKKGGDYLTTISFDIGAEEPVREVYKDFFCVLSQKWFYHNEDVIAWMPLPEPYKASPTGAERSDKE